MVKKLGECWNECILQGAEVLDVDREFTGPAVSIMLTSLGEVIEEALGENWMFC
jgi:hypothetical protein